MHQPHETAIAVENLTKRYLIYGSPKDRLKQFLWRGRRSYYRELLALNGVSLNIKRGETVGLVGRNGSGKSTLLQILAGTVSPTSGTCAVNGRLSALLELGAGFNPEFTGRENIHLNAAILGLKPDEIAAKYPSIVEFAGIGEFIERPVKTYSSGMYVRLAFAIAVAVEPDILVVDEALAVGDEAFQKKCFDRIRGIKERGGTILFVSHAAGAIVELCDRAILMDAGEMIDEGSPRQVIAHYHKLIFAPVEKTQAVRESIKQHSIDAPVKATAENQQQDAGMLGNVAPQPVPAETGELFNPGMIPETTVVYEPGGAEISDARITTVDGRQVNILQRGGTYEFRFMVTFEQAAQRVLFGMLIKTRSGFELGGGTSAAPGEELAAVAAGGQVEVAFRFRCLLAPGAYFVNCGCSALKNDERTFLHRIIDAVMFKVMPEAHLTVGGIVDFMLEPRVEIQ